MNENMIALRDNFNLDIQTINVNGNPTIVAPDMTSISLRQNHETLGDIDNYISFLKSAVSQFRSSGVYDAYKSHLINDIGLNRCQFMSNIPITQTEDKKSPITIEMNHCILTIFDIALIIAEHTIQTYGSISTPELVALIEEEHRCHRIPLVMMTKSVHQAYHSDPLFFVHPNMVFGKWWEFLQKYRYGITPDIAAKILYYIEKSETEYGSSDNNLLQVASYIEDWGCRNGDSYISLDDSCNFDFD